MDAVPATPPPAREQGDSHPRVVLTLSLAALGVVFGDIGTSPLYALRECFHGLHAIAPTPANVLGVLSLIFWSLVLVISTWYVAFIMRADNKGEGGIMALLALLLPRRGAIRRLQGIAIALALLGTSLLYGDSVITPAISVLSAMEGLNIATPLFQPFVVPLTVGVLVALFAIQRRGTAGVGAIFGPVMLLWFATIAALGLRAIAAQPGVLVAVDPRHAVDFFLRNGMAGYLVLGAVVLAVTGAEALYADMGHFGHRPIRLSWFALVLPALLLNYFGQGALLLRDPESAFNPFYRLSPDWGLYPLVVLATAATVIASQAVISSAFSITRQAVFLGYVPRLDIEHTSSRRIGQIYVRRVNGALMIATIGLVLGFRSATNLAGAYGVAVTGTMVMTTSLFALLAWRRWRWHPLLVLLLASVFLSIDLSLFGSTLVKIGQGGWFPLTVAAGIYTLMTTWKRGRQILAARLAEKSEPVARLVARLAETTVTRVPGTAVFLTSNPTGLPPALVQNLKHNKVLHERVILLTVSTGEVPVVPPEERVEIQLLAANVWRVKACYGFMEEPDIPRLLEQVRSSGVGGSNEDTTFFVGREMIIASSRPGMAQWRERLFAVMSRNAQRATPFFRIPPDRVIEVGAQVEL
ncbi:MAG: potassium transporter Kup [Acidobacteria bacterium]|nr:potassium transporter Kup [Acidobacteriota bacterium]